MRPHKQRAWNKDIKIMITAEEMMSEDSVYMYLNDDDDYIWMRTTEKLDCNEQEIFEGDIVHIQEPTSSCNDVVVFEDGCFIFKDIQIHCGAYDSEQLTIIGNNHENPEVLHTDLPPSLCIEDYLVDLKELKWQEDFVKEGVKYWGQFGKENSELMKEEKLPPQFVKDALEGLRQVKAGEVEVYKFGEENVD